MAAKRGVIKKVGGLQRPKGWQSLYNSQNLVCYDTSKEAAMKPVFQEVLTVAMAKLSSSLAQETGETQGRE